MQTAGLVQSDPDPDPEKTEVPPFFSHRTPLEIEIQ